MRMNVKELIRLGEKVDVNKVLCSIILSEEDDNCIELLGQKKRLIDGKETLISLIKADGDMEDVLKTLGIPLVDCTDVSATLFDGVDRAVVRGHANPSRFVYEEYELLLDFNDIVLEENILWEHCPHCKFDVPLRHSSKKQHCPNCNETIKSCSLYDMDKAK